MLFQSIIASASLVGLALAANHDVMVGMDGLTFTPNTTTAANGDTVTFHFYPMKHSVVQAAFATPCEPMAGGFYSGFVPTSSGESMTTFMITVNETTKPIWFYCSQASHCQSGMVGAINAPTTGNTIEKFVASAKSASNNTTPSVTAGTGGTLSAMNMTSASGTMTMSMSSTATGTAASSTGTGAASALEVSKGLGFSAAFAFLGYLFV
ncbi:Cupredoxin [Glonium stellatum]|uniref:Cupredoxin n=1 Tax=Glonium stellatum TaxID=574774 RepID=A0A8E2FBR6_9PEZI|nr:Cupredoxin [Glonium stellatum]